MNSVLAPMHPGDGGRGMSAGCGFFSLFFRQLDDNRRICGGCTPIIGAFTLAPEVSGSEVVCSRAQPQEDQSPETSMRFRGFFFLLSTSYCPLTKELHGPVIVVMKRGATHEQIEHMIQRVEQLGLKAHPIYGTERTVIAAVGEKRDEFRQSLESGPGVAEVMPILAPYKSPAARSSPSRPSSAPAAWRWATATSA